MLYFYNYRIEQVQQMGNNSQSIPENYKESANPQLRNALINQLDNLLEMKILPGPGFSNWKWNLCPLQNHQKYLFLPLRFVDPEMQKVRDSGWCRQDNGNVLRQPYIVAQYPSYIYTLENEILVRKKKKMYFKEHELWKILKAGATALKQWSQVYPDLSICKLTPRNIVFNSQGQIKIINRFSFIEPPHEITSNAYTPPPSPIKTNQISQETPLSLSIFSLGVCLLDAVSLAQSQYSNMSTIEKKELLHNSNIYPLEIKSTILRMAQPNTDIRIGLLQIFQNMRKYKRLSTHFSP